MSKKKSPSFATTTPAAAPPPEAPAAPKATPKEAIAGMKARLDALACGSRDVEAVRVELRALVGVFEELCEQLAAD